MNKTNPTLILPKCTTCKKQIVENEIYFKSWTYLEPKGDGGVCCEKCVPKKDLKRQRDILEQYRNYEKTN